MLPRARWNLSFSTVTDNAHLYAEITPRLFCAKVFFNLDQPEGSWQSRSKVRHGNSTKKAPIFFTPLTSCQTLAKLGLHLIINMCFSFQESWTCGLLEMQTWESSWFAMQYYYVLLMSTIYCTKAVYPCLPPIPFSTQTWDGKSKKKLAMEVDFTSAKRPDEPTVQEHPPSTMEPTPQDSEATITSWDRHTKNINIRRNRYRIIRYG